MSAMTSGSSDQPELPVERSVGIQRSLGGRHQNVGPPSAPDFAHPSESAALIIDCDRCSVRGSGCPDCVVTFLLGGPPAGISLIDEERHALDVLANAGLVPPLRMVEPVDTRHPDRG